MRRRRLTPLLTNFIVGETHGLVLSRLGSGLARRWLFGNVWPIERLTADDEVRARDILRRYDDKSFSYVDATSFSQEAVCCAERAVGDGRGRGGHARGGGKPGLSGAAWGGGAYGERMRCGRRTRGAPGVRPETAERSGVPRGRVGGGSEWRTRSATTSVGGGWP